MKDAAVAGLYCDFHAQREQSTTNMLGAIIKQLVSGEEIPGHIREAFQKAKNERGGRGLQLPDMVEILKRTITSLPRVFICIDALDECTPRHRQALLESLQDIVGVSPNIRVFLTARPNINDEIVRHFIRVVRVPLSSTHADIKSYLEMRLDQDDWPGGMYEELRGDIIRTILETVSER